jgi:hypothetical protein
MKNVRAFLLGRFCWGFDWLGRTPKPLHAPLKRVLGATVEPIYAPTVKAKAFS